MVRKNSIFLVALLTALTLTATLAPTALAKNSKPPPAQYNGPPISGLRASAADFSGETPGIGTIDKATCTDGTDLGGGNIRINCDAIDLPHNEMSIAVDPANPNHIVAGSNDYELVALVGREPVVIRRRGGGTEGFEEQIVCLDAGRDHRVCPEQVVTSRGIVHYVLEVEEGEVFRVVLGVGR